MLPSLFDILCLVIEHLLLKVNGTRLCMLKLPFFLELDLLFVVLNDKLLDQLTLVLIIHLDLRLGALVNILIKLHAFLLDLLAKLDVLFSLLLESPLSFGGLGMEVACHLILGLL